MSSTAATEPSLASNSAAKKKNNKKKKNANKSKEPAQTSNGDARIDKDELDDEPDTPTTAEIPSTSNVNNTEEPKSETNGHPVAPSNHEHPEPHAPAQQPDGESDTSAKLEAMSKEREALRVEVEQLRKQLESIQENHQAEVSQLQAELEDSNAARETAEEQYQTLLGRVEKIKETLSDRLKRDKAELEEAKEHIEELEAQNEELRNAAESSSESLAKVREELQDATRELTTLRSRNNLSANNWGKEREELIRSIQHLKEEMETTSNAMGEWEVIAMEERSIKENLGDKVAELEEEVVGLREGYEAAAAERDSQATLIDNLQNALREIQDARKKELRDLVETSEAQLQEQKKLVQEAVAKATEAQEAKAELVKELERTVPFEKEVKEKNLLIGKLRHEAIVLNDHLTKALRYLKKTKPEDNVDRQVVTNHLLHFLTLDRGDAKRFQVLQVMAGYLNWTDEQREQAGLARPGGSTNSLRLPLSPFQRTPSSPSLSADIFSEPSSARDRESLAELWAGFLERSAQEGTSDGPSRKGSTSSVATAGVTIGRPESRS
ncbi:Golgi matrix protein, rud3, involved in the structural organization of the cis-Golgi [Trichoderma simmonsii]|uniref:Golgi matrix protein, rud3, involved in the structural organization of the cis-Golgi n=1 Tax=Trichoderma simmonsii TaxID=1491479 RepID=A0A8G0LH83_9HYPO|nr:Golgi matrix protein, rud3, involved in the structural organization of the cis-Golgi [Trichoderma simmonsii]